MSIEQGRYVLEKEVTSLAKAKKRTGTAVLSVRLTTEELAEVEAASRATGKTVSQIVRDAIKMCLYFEEGGGYSITMSGPLDTLSTGQVWHSGRATQSSVELSMA